MTREEAIKELERAVDVLDHQCHMDNRKKEAFNMAIKALSAEPCEDAISFPKGTLKKRGKGYVVYDVEWFKKNWRTELNVMGVECEDAISRAWIKEAIHNLYHYSRHTPTEEDIQEYIVDDAPPVTPKVSECEDCISRAELLKAIDTWDRFGVDDTNSLFRLDNLSLPHYVPYIHFDDVVKCIKGMPSVTPKQKMGRWISVSERLPGYGEKVLCWTTYNAFKVGYRDNEWGQDVWTTGEFASGTFRVDAWMPLPEPYRAESED